MDHSYLTSRPKRRHDGLIVREVEAEVIVYDVERHEAHCLNPEAGRIWNACDGNRTGQEILHFLFGDQPDPRFEAALLIGLQQLREKRLLDNDSAGTTVGLETHVSRRELLARYGKVAAVAVALPAVMSIVSPTPAEASSCLPSLASCTSPAQCCSGICASGKCV